MIRQLVLFSFIFLGMISSAQVPVAFKYQVVARDAEGQILANRNLTLKISILKSNEKGTVVYSEIHTRKSNLFGLIDLVIGKGNAMAGSLNGIDWSADSYYFQVEIDPDGGSVFQSMGISQLMSVPYALCSQDVVNNNDADPDPLNEIQKLTIAGNTLTLDNGGGSVVLPASAGGDDWGKQSVVTGLTLTGNGTPTNPLGVIHSQLQPLWSQVTEKPAGFSDNVDNVEDGDADPGNEIQVLSKNGNIVVLSRSGGSFTDSVNDADSDPLNEIQKLNITGNILTLDNGGGSVSLPVSGGGDNWGIQVAATNSTISGEGTPANPLGVVHSQLQPLWSQVTEKPAGFSDNVDNVEDGDADPGNEIQVLSKNGNTVLLSRNGGSFTDSVNDADSDPLNEIQKLTITGNILTLDNGGGSVSLPVSGGGDNWGIQVAATNSTIAGDGTSANPLGVVHSQLQLLWNQVAEKPAGFSDNIDNVEDGDADPGNEIQVLSKAGNMVLLSKGGGSFIDSVEDADPNPGNEVNIRMEWDDHNNILSISDSGGKLSTELTGFLETESDGSVTNEGSLSVGSGTVNSSHILSNTRDSQPVVLQAGMNVSISESQNVITIEATDTNTKYAAGTGIDISNNTISMKGIASDHYLGEIFGGGIIFWLTPDRQHGLIASLRDIDNGEGIAWSNITEVEIGLNARNMTNGLANTEAIITQNGHLMSAAKLCADYVADGFSDWYLPSDRELILLASQDYLIDNILDNDNNPETAGFMQEYNPPTYGSYWSSTEGSAAYSWVFDFGYGGIYDVTKNLTYRVRAIRKF